MHVVVVGVQQVAKNFREIFGELAAGGRGELVMQKRLRPEPQEEADPEDDEEAGAGDMSDAMERYAGVKVKVRHGHHCVQHSFVYISSDITVQVISRLV